MRISLAVLARLSGSDKIGAHDYIEAYSRFFSKYRNRKITLLEIGVGGYDSSEGGNSLLLWKSYFPRGNIVGIDLYDKTHLSRGRLHVYQCSQTDMETLGELAKKYGGFDIIIDDGSHLNEHQIRTFIGLFPWMKENGIYVIEDTQTSYWPAFGGGAVGSPGYAKSATHFFKSLVDGLNHAEFLPEDQVPDSPFSDQIDAIYFEHNLIIIAKGKNTARSNFDVPRLARDLKDGAASQAGLLR